MGDFACASKGCGRSGFYEERADTRTGSTIRYYCGDHFPPYVADRAEKARDERLVNRLCVLVNDESFPDEADRRRARELLERLP